MAKHEKGQRVTTPHGAGTVSGFERFDRDGKSLPPAQVDKGGRVIVTLDTPADWPGASPACPDPYYWRGEINPI